MQSTSYEDRPSVPYAPLPIYRMAEAANVLIGVGSFVGLAAGTLIAGYVHIALVWRLLMVIGVVGAAGCSAWALRLMMVGPRKRYLRSLILAFAAEISNQVAVVQEAIFQGLYWNPAERQLPTNVWLKHPELAAEPKLADAFFATVAAYQHADRLNWVARRRVAGEMPGTIGAPDQLLGLRIENESQDGLDRALLHMGAAYNALRKAAEDL